MPHVIVRLMGGLGNQMFQYATGLAQAERLKVPLLLDRTFLDHRPADQAFTPRDFELDVFPVPIAFATDEQVRSIRKPWDDRTYRIARRFLPFLFADHCFRERGKAFDPAINERKAPLYLEGYWQNEQYFNAIAGRLRHELFVPKDQPSARNAEIASAIKSTVSASMHVRRGDYVSNAEANRFHGVCSVEYYESSAKLLAEQHGTQHFFLFSDDPDWVRSNIKLPYPTTYIAHNTGRESHWDLWLMKQCKHHIIANSSFSWWGAWLNASPNKTVIGPAKWFQGTNIPADAILPPTWIAH